MLIDDDPDLQALLIEFFGPRGIEVIVTCAVEGSKSLILERAVSSQPIEAVIVDYQLPVQSGLDFLEQTMASGDDLPVIFLTGHASLELEKECRVRGVFEFLVKPTPLAQLACSVERALTIKRGQDTPHFEKGKQNVYPRNKQVCQIYRLAEKAARSPATVLIQGRSGTGKEILAQFIHDQSPRATRPFVAVNCSAIPESLLESEFFGHAKGAFTGAAENRKGLFEEANGGTLFLDEIGELSYPLQSKILRAIQEKSVRRVGENHYREVNVRIISATNRSLEDEVREKRFREDLFYRLSIIPFWLPDLAERKEDILPLAHFFLGRLNETFKTAEQKRFGSSGIKYLLEQSWPGNIRELQNAIERAVALSDGLWLEVENFRECGGGGLEAAVITNIRPNVETGMEEEIRFRTDSETEKSDQPCAFFNAPELVTLDQLEWRYIQFVMKSVGGAKEKAAKILGVDRKTLYRKLL